MSIVAGPDIIEDGLVLCLDAANARSYPGTGTAWVDLVGEDSNGVLTNGPTYSSSNEGGIVFDGTNDYINNSTANINITNDICLNIWFKHSNVSTPTNQIYFDITTNSRFSLYKQGTSLIFSTRPPGLGGFWTTGGSHNFSNNTIYNVVAQHKSATGQSSVYKNNVLLASFAPHVYGLSESNVNYTVSSTGSPFIGSIYYVGLYTRSLSATELTQNYNALKWRYGL